LKPPLDEAGVKHPVIKAGQSGKLPALATRPAEHRAAKALAANLQQIKHKKASSFSILPLCCFDTQHVAVNYTVLHGLLKSIAKRGECRNLECSKNSSTTSRQR
jgi:hypothetical protein